MINKSFSLKQISEYRQVLMGVGIIGVLLAHWYGFQKINSGISYTLVSFFCKFVFTEGFLFLSGFGLYYSFSNNSEIITFYKKRVIRLLIPYMFLSFPVFILRYGIESDYRLIDIFMQISTLYFWFNGNFFGMWYISLSVLLYILFPFIFKFIFKNKPSPFLRLVFLLSSIYLFLILFRFFSPQHYELIEIGISKIPIFYVGMYYGFLSKEKRISNINYTLWVISLIILYSIASFYKYENYWIMNFCSLTQKLIFIPIICYILSSTANFHIIKLAIRILTFFGKYSLEMYIVHLHVYLILFITQGLHNLNQLTVASISIFSGIVFSVPANRYVNSILNYISRKK